MKLKGKHFTAMQPFCLILYYGVAIFLPRTGRFFNLGGWCRRFLCQRIFRRCGKHVNIERGANFGRGTDIEIGDYSGIGINAVGYISEGTAHEWHTWRRSLYQFAQLLFK